MGLEINNVVVSGNLTRDVELKELSSGRKVCAMGIANNRTYVSNGQKTEEVSFFDVEVWGVIAENCAKYLSKGSPVVVVGRIKQERWETEQGDKRSRIKVVAATVQFLMSGNKGGDGSSQTSTASAAPAASTSTTAEAWS